MPTTPTHSRYRPSARRTFRLLVLEADRETELAVAAWSPNATSEARQSLLFIKPQAIRTGHEFPKVRECQSCSLIYEALQPRLGQTTIQQMA